jgi:hypothetical protein
MKIMVFLHGTISMHAAGQGRSRAERVQQVVDGDASVHAYASYIPIGEAAAKLRGWKKQGADIVYLSSQKARAILKSDNEMLARNGFPEGELEFRRGIESYAAVVQRVLPDVLIEDDCESIGGEKEMTYPDLPAELQKRIRSIVVPEFGGIDGLPVDISALKEF